MSKEIKLKKVKKKELLEFRTRAMHAMEFFMHSRFPVCLPAFSMPPLCTEILSPLQRHVLKEKHMYKPIRLYECFHSAVVSVQFLVFGATKEYATT